MAAQQPNTEVKVRESPGKNTPCSQYHLHKRFYPARRDLINVCRKKNFSQPEQNQATSDVVRATTTTSHRITLSYEDNGKGVPADQKEKIFACHHRTTKMLALYLLVRSSLSPASLRIP